MMNSKFQSLVDELESQAYEISRQHDGLVPTGAFVVNFAKLVAERVLQSMEPTQAHQAYAQSYLGGVDGLEMLETKIAQARESLGLPKESGIKKP